MVVEGEPYFFADELVLDVPVDTAGGCTRKSILLRREHSPDAVKSTAVRLHDGRVVIVLPPTICATQCKAIRVEVTPVQDARRAQAPADLLKILQGKGLMVVLESLPEHEIRHLISMVREARNLTVRAERIAAVVERLETCSL